MFPLTLWYITSLSLCPISIEQHIHRTNWFDCAQRGIENCAAKCQINAIEPDSSIDELPKVYVHEQHRSSSRELTGLHDGGDGSRVDDGIGDNMGSRTGPPAKALT